MPKFVDAVITSRPEHLWVFDGGTPANVTDRGLGTVTAVLNNAVNAQVTAVPSIIPRSRYSQHIGVVETVDAAYYETGIGQDLFGTGRKPNWTVELLVRLEDKQGPSGLLFGVEQSGQPVGLVTGLDVDGRFFKFTYASTAGVQELLVSDARYEREGLFHLVLLCTDDKISLYVNNTIHGSGDAIDQVAASTALRVGGWDSTNHADADWGLFAVYYKLLESIDTHYALLDYESQYEFGVLLLEPVFSHVPESDGIGRNEPRFESIAYGAGTELYVDENELLRIKSLSPGATGTKTQQFDISEITAGVVSYVDVVGDVTLEYSVNGVDYSTLTEGENTITELDTYWGFEV